MNIRLRIAYLILCHNDPQHIFRLCNRLTEETNNDVFIHIDKKIPKEPFYKLMANKSSIYFVEDRVKVFWGGYSSIKATINLIKLARSKSKYDRYILLQGADYPIKSNEEIENFFEKNREVEFIRACNISKSKDKYFYSRWSCFWFYDEINLLKKVINKANRIFNFKLRKKLMINNKMYDIYWGSAQWALTDKCVEYILEFNEKNNYFNQYFKYIFPPDETYFHTIIFNSHFKYKTTNKNVEKEKKYLVNWRNLHYFEYEGSIKVYTSTDYNFLRNRDELFIRKVNTEESKKLLDLLDKV